MRLILFTLFASVLVGYAAGGRLWNVAGIPLRWPALALGGIGLQFVPLGRGATAALLLLSFALLIVFAAANARFPGFALILVGLALNTMVIAINQGMPVTRYALVASGQQATFHELVAGGGSKHHLAGDDHLLFLGDVIPLGWPLSQAVSVGDLLVHAGVFLFVVSGMRRRPTVGSRGTPVAKTPP